MKFRRCRRTAASLSSPPEHRVAPRACGSGRWMAPRWRVWRAPTVRSFHFFSPDGHSIGFFTERALQRIDLPAGPVRRICQLSGARAPRDGGGASWGSDGTIVFAPRYGERIYRVPATGGQPEPVTTVDRARGEQAHTA